MKPISKPAGLLFILAAILPLGARAQPTRPKLAVIVLGAGVEPNLADDLTEVIIARIAKTGIYELAGKEEFRGKLGVENDVKALACIEEPACLSRAGAALGVTRVLAGTIGRRDRDYLFSLALHDLASGKVDNRSFKLVPGGVPALIRTAEESAVTIFERLPEPGNVRVETAVKRARVYIDDAFMGTAPVRSPLIEPGKHHLRVEAEDHLDWGRSIEVPSGGTLDISLAPEALPRRRSWPKYFAWGSLGLATGAAAAGGLLAVLSQEAPTGTTRRDQLSDVDHKHTQAIAANVLFGAAGALAITSGVLFYAYRADIFGGSAQVAAAVTLKGQMVASLRW